MKVNIFDRYTHLFIRFYNGEIHSNVAIIKKDKKGNYIDGQKDIKIKLNYVHTLQNFIALTGKELTK